MEVRIGEKTIYVHGWVIAAGFTVIGKIVTDICRTVDKKERRD